eukprot:gene27368-33057_t
MTTKEIRVSRHPIKGFGVCLSFRSEQSVVVTELNRASDALAKGLKLGDTVVRLNNISVSTMTVSQLGGIMSNSELLVLEYIPANAEIIDLVSDDESSCVDHRRLSAPFVGETPNSGRLVGSSQGPFLDLTQDDVIGAKPISSISATSVERVLFCESKESTAADLSFAEESSAGEKRNFDSLGEIRSETLAKRRREKGVTIKEEFPPKAFGKANIGDEVVETLPAAFFKEIGTNPASSNSSSSKQHSQGADDIVIVGDGELFCGAEMPHQREGCSKFPFKLLPVLTLSSPVPTCNMQHCAHCYCFICEVTAADCYDWAFHCNASHRLDLCRRLKSDKKLPIMSLLSNSARKALYGSHYREIFADLYFGGQSESLKKALARWRAFMSDVNDSPDKLVTAVVFLGRLIGLSRMCAVELFEEPVLDCAFHHLCPPDALNTLRTLTVAPNALCLMRCIDAAISMLSEKPAEAEMAEIVQTHPEKLLGLIRRGYSRMTTFALSRFFDALKTLRPSWSVLMGLACVVNSLSTSQQELEAFQESLVALCNNPSLAWVSVSSILQNCSIPPEANEQSLIKLTSILVATLETFSTTAVVSYSVVASIFHLQLQRASPPPLLEQLRKFITWLRGYSSPEGVVQVLAPVLCNVEFTIRMCDFCHNWSDGGLDSSDYFQSLSVTIANRALIHFAYSPEKCAVLPAVMQKLSRLPSIQFADHPTETKYHVHLNPLATSTSPDHVLDFSSRRELFCALLKPNSPHSAIGKMVFGDWLSFNDTKILFNRRMKVWDRMPTQEDRTASIVGDLLLVKYLWKSLLISIYKTVVDADGDIYEALITPDGLRQLDVNPEILNIVLNKDFVAKNGIEPACLLSTFYMLDAEPTFYMLFCKMKRTVQRLVEIWTAVKLSPSVLSQVFVLESFPGFQELCTLVSSLYKGLINRLIDKISLKIEQPVSDNFLLALAREDWAGCRDISFKSPSFIFTALRKVDADSICWSAESVDANMSTLVELVEEAIHIRVASTDRCHIYIHLKSSDFNSLAWRLIEMTSLEFALAYASLSCPPIVSRLITHYAKLSACPGCEEKLGMVESKINYLLSTLPEQLFTGKLCQIIYVCGFLGRYDICLDKYKIDIFGSFGDGVDEVLNVLICFCPQIMLEKLVRQLLPMLSTRGKAAGYPMYIAHIERGVKHISSPGYFDSARREVLFYHFQNSIMLQNAVTASNRDPSTMDRLLNFVKSQAPLDWEEHVSMLHMLLGEEGFGDYLLTWELPSGLSMDEVAKVYKKVIGLLVSKVQQDKGLVFLASVLYRDEPNASRVCVPSDIPEDWLHGSSQGDNQSDVSRTIAAAKALIILIKNPERAPECIPVLLVSDQEMYNKYKGKLIKNIIATQRLKLCIYCLYEMGEYKALFEHIKSLAFSSDGDQLLKGNLARSLEAVDFLQQRLSSKIFPNLDILQLNVLSANSFLCQLFCYVATVFGSAIGCHNSSYDTFICDPLRALISKVVALSGGSQFVKDYLLCAMTQMVSYSPSMLLHDNEEVASKIERCCEAIVSSNVKLLWDSEPGSLLNVMIATIAETGSLLCKLQLLSVALRLASNQPNAIYSEEFLRTFTHTLLQNSFMIVNKDNNYLPIIKTYGLRTSITDDRLPRRVVALLDKFGRAAAEALEASILEALSGFTAVVSEGGKVTTIGGDYPNRVMLLNVNWRQVCSKMAAVDDRFGHLAIFAVAENSWLPMLPLAYQHLQLEVEKRGNMRMAVILYNRLIRSIIYYLARNEQSSKFTDDEYARFLALLFKMCSDIQRNAAVKLFPDIKELMSMFKRMSAFTTLIQRNCLSNMPYDSIAAVPELVCAFTENISVLQLHKNLSPFWSSLLQHAGDNKPRVMKSLLKLVRTVANECRNTTMVAHKFGQLVEFVDNFKMVIAPHRQGCEDMIASEVTQACAFVGNKPKVVGELRRVRF